MARFPLLLLLLKKQSLHQLKNHKSLQNNLLLE